MNAEETDEIHALDLAKWLREERRPLCPQFRPHHIERLYPVQGYCVLSQLSGWFMIPSVEQYRGVLHDVAVWRVLLVQTDRGKRRTRADARNHRPEWIRGSPPQSPSRRRSVGGCRADEYMSADAGRTNR
jgi:hypothetical protein